MHGDGRCHCTMHNRNENALLAAASIFTGIFIVAASYAECDKMWVVVHFAISVAFQGVPGVAVNSLDLSPNYAGVLMGIGNTVSSITGILVPYIVGVATPNVSKLWIINKYAFCIAMLASPFRLSPAKRRHTFRHLFSSIYSTGTADRMAWNILDYIHSASDQNGHLLDLGPWWCAALGHAIRLRNRQITEWWCLWLRNGIDQWSRACSIIILNDAMCNDCNYEIEW